MSSRPIGFVGETSTPVEIAVKASHPVPAGTYIYLKFKVRDPITNQEFDREVVGIIGSVSFKSYIPVITATVSETPESYITSDLKRESYMNAVIVADITGGRVEAPRYPPPPETPVYPARAEYLRLIYRSKPESSIKAGSLLGFEELDVNVDVNALAKHLLVVGTTGSGKSNFVAVLADRVAQLGGSVVIFDVHGEYRGLKSESESVQVVDYEATINLIKTPIEMLVKFIIPESAATRQRRLLRNALRKLNEEIVKTAAENRIPYSEAVKRVYAKGKRSENLEKIEKPEEMYRELLKKNMKDSEKSDKTVVDVEDKVDDFFEWHQVGLDTPNVSEIVGCGRVVIADVSALIDTEKDYMLKVIAEDLLWSLKQRRIPPTMLVVEEAHLFISSRNPTWSKESLQRFIREGRKFGGMLVVVSQRPRALDPDVASQIQNFVLLKLVQRSDRAIITEVSDVLSEEYVNILPSLSPGQAILLGEWIGRYPALVKIDLHRGKRVGATPDVVGLWRKRLEEISEGSANTSPSSEWEGV
ncbi:MAG: ATP-binding protein [Desulfurococcaceae archaeon]|nr:ATP-binding protein [Desulfurococcaceae archaeon]